MAADPGLCPNCERPLVHTTEFRALSDADLEAEIQRQLLLERERRKLPLT
jgi:hypothetical protein